MVPHATLTCNCCKQLFEVPQWRLKEKPRFCSIACRGKDQTRRAQEAFNARFDANVIIIDGGCWPWIGGRNKAGYGWLCDPFTHKVEFTHRISYTRHIGPIPDGLTIDHLCRNPGCVNPAHLEAVTHVENTMRGIGPPAENARKTVCKRGHPLSGENLYQPPGGGRRCRECLRLRSMKAREGYEGLLDTLGRRNIRTLADRECSFCHRAFRPQNSKSRYCSRACQHKGVVPTRTKDAQGRFTSEPQAELGALRAASRLLAGFSGEGDEDGS
jgi:hypothetical protein